MLLTVRQKTHTEKARGIFKRLANTTAACHAQLCASSVAGRYSPMCRLGHETQYNFVHALAKHRKKLVLSGGKSCV